MFIGQFVRIRGGTHTIYTGTCADEGGTQVVLFMLYIVNITMATKLCRPTAERGMGKGM